MQARRACGLGTVGGDRTYGDIPDLCVASRCSESDGSLGSAVPLRSGGVRVFAGDLSAKGCQNLSAGKGGRRIHCCNIYQNDAESSVIPSEGTFEFWRKLMGKPGASICALRRFLICKK